MLTDKEIMILGLELGKSTSLELDRQAAEIAHVNEFEAAQYVQLIAVAFTSMLACHIANVNKLLDIKKRHLKLDKFCSRRPKW